MKLRTKLFALTAGLLAVTGFAATATVSAGPVFISNDKGSTSVEKGKTVDGSAYLAGNSVVVDGTVNGDVYCAGNNVTVTGTVNGDLICAGANITVDGIVRGDIRLAASNITIGGSVDGSATVAAADVWFKSGSKLASDLTGGASTIRLDGVVGRDVTAGTETLNVNGEIGRDVNSSLTTIEFGTQGLVKGQLNYSAQDKSTVPADAVKGEVVYNEVDDNGAQNGSSSAAKYFVGPLFIAGTMIVFALLVSAVLPRYISSVAAVSWQRFALAALVGLTFLVVAPIAAILMMLTVVGILPGIVLLVVWMLVGLLSSVPVAYFVGNQFFGEKLQNILGRAALGALLLAVLLFVPVLNVIVYLAVVLAGSGMIIMHLQRQYGDGAYHAISQPAPKKKAATKKRA